MAAYSTSRYVLRFSPRPRSQKHKSWPGSIHGAFGFPSKAPILNKTGVRSPWLDISIVSSIRVYLHKQKGAFRNSWLYYTSTGHTLVGERGQHFSRSIHSPHAFLRGSRAFLLELGGISYAKTVAKYNTLPLQKTIIFPPLCGVRDGRRLAHPSASIIVSVLRESYRARYARRDHHSTPRTIIRGTVIVHHAEQAAPATPPSEALDTAGQDSTQLL